MHPEVSEVGSPMAATTRAVRGEKGGGPQDAVPFVYAILPDQIVVVAIAHTRKAPGYWLDRLAELS